MNILSITGFVLLTLLVSRPALTAETQPGNTLMWRLADLSPTYIRSGKYQGQGNGEGIIDILSKNLPDYTHTREYMPVARFLRITKRGDNYCYPSFQKNNEREETLYFSIPALVTPGFQVAIRKQDWQSKFKGAGRISFASLLQNKNLVLGIFPGRSYSPALDGILNAFAKKHVFHRQAMDTSKGLVKMLARNRIDYMIIKSPSLQWELTLLNNDEIIGLPIIETPPFYIGHVVCTKNEWGKQVIEKVNRILKRERNTKAYRHVVERWVGKYQLKLLRAYYRQLIAEGTGYL